MKSPTVWDMELLAARERRRKNSEIRAPFQTARDYVSRMRRIHMSLRRGGALFCACRLGGNLRLDLARQRAQMIRQPREQRALLLIGGEIADQRTLGRIGAQLFEVRLHVL